MRGPILYTERTTPEHAEMVLGLLDDDTLRTEAALDSDPMESIKDSSIAWFKDAAGEKHPLAVFGVIQPQPGYPATAWMMTLKGADGRLLIRIMRGVLRAVVKKYDKVQGACMIRSEIPRLMQVFGATFVLPAHPKFLMWELRDNYKLRRAA